MHTTSLQNQHTDTHADTDALKTTPPFAIATGKKGELKIQQT